MAESRRKDGPDLAALAATTEAAWKSKNLRAQLKAAASAKRGRAALTGKIAVAGGMRMLLRAVKNILLAVIVAAFAASVLSRFKDIKNYPEFLRVVEIDRQLEAPALSALRQNIPTNYEGTDIARFVLLGALFVAAMLLRGFAFKFASDVVILRRKRDALIKASSALDKDKLDRGKLLEVYAEVRKSLDEHKQNLAFLSIDIVDSTGMKVGEDKSIAENDFRQYKRMVEGILKANQAMKSTWTPDGVMICFPSAANAVKAAQSVILGLDDFNRTIKVMRRDFKIRAGINSGEVFCDKDTPMEEMTDRVIDIAGHMQKHGLVDGIAISEHAIQPFLGKFSFRDSGRIVDGCSVYEWKKDSA